MNSAEPDSEMSKMIEVSVRDFKIHMYEQIGTFSRQMEIIGELNGNA